MLFRIRDSVRVDLRVICSINSKKYDVGFGEFAKYFSAPKARQNRTKLILEGKEALNTIFKIVNNYTVKVVFYTFHIAGLKGNLISTCLQDDGLYVSQNVSSRIRFPLACW
ncbi:unnamed protein product [Mucor hiemalis]